MNGDRWLCEAVEEAEARDGMSRTRGCKQFAGNTRTLGNTGKNGPGLLDSLERYK